MERSSRSSAGSSFDGTGGPGTSTSWEQHYGDGDIDLDLSSLAPSYTRTDKALALFRLGVGCCFIVLGTCALARFYRSKRILDIRTRSAYLVMVGGVAGILTMLVTVNDATTVIWDTGFDWFWTSLLLFFISPALFGSYICRALRLAVVFHPRVKRALPWLIPERNYMVVLLVSSVGMLAIPIYHEHTLGVWDAISKQTTILKIEARVLAVALACIYPFIRNVDDLFSISTELIIVTATIGLITIVQEIDGLWGGCYERRWLANNLSVLFMIVLFGVSIVAPLRRLASDPFAATRRNYANRVLPDHTEPHSIGGNRLDAVRTGQTERGDDRGRDGGRRSRSHKQDIDLWDFERIVRTPLLAVAFEDYSKRALCHESFPLSERGFSTHAKRDAGSSACPGSVWRYQNGDYATTTRASSGSSFPTQFGTFCYITDTFIKAGSPEEVNISDKERKLILALYHKGEELFEDVNDEERRMIFRRAYLAVKRMLEANLLLRFLNTDRFKSVEMQKENTQVMVDSLSLQAGVAVS
ncbi:hypothetical protein Esi_0260_0003 [Ectocarpus siliculosus]|uniref:RGS domain-containing protein n=1 Tax=Ectocarpus siliculosus TaxID=2880 RepID=D7FTV8_ECTSI|nr:hypothetical protein Esi_0260_0003 [Ectocarpus siliculosus]|eukprot:CBJ31485.1 hypothetical protein Esi_0260_0003 [Ectocarpus siliculosus]